MEVTCGGDYCRFPPVLSLALIFLPNIHSLQLGGMSNAEKDRQGAEPSVEEDDEPDEW